MPTTAFSKTVLSALCASLFAGVAPLRANEPPDNRPLLAERERLITLFHDQGTAAIAELTQRLDHASELVRRTAAHLLVRLGEPARESLVMALEHPDFLLRRIIMHGLDALGLFMAHWPQVIRDDHPSIMREVQLYWLPKQFETLAGDALASALEQIEAAYLETDAPVRRNLVEMLIALEPAPEDQAWEILRRAARDAEAEIAEIAFQVVGAPRMAHMREQVRTREWAMLVETFADTEFAEWPDAAMAREAFFLRGQAFYHLRNGEAAKADLTRSIDLSPNRHALWLLGQTYRDLLEDRAAALETFVEAVETRVGFGGWLFYSVVIDTARLMRDNGDYDAALAMLDRTRPDALGGSWGARMQSEIAGTLAEAGRIEAARERYRQALALEGVSDGQRNAIREALEALAKAEN